MIRFGVFEADLESGELRKQGLRVKLQDQPFQILAMLLARPGQIVTRDELQKTLWRADTFVDFDRGLNKAMNRLREALEDSADNPRFIETVPKRGYRFVAPVESTHAAAAPVITTDPPGRSIRQRRADIPGREKFAWILVALLCLSFTLALPIRHRSVPPRPRLLRSSLLPPPNTWFVPYNFAISPDGKRLAFVVMDREARTMLWVRALSGAAAQPLAGTEGATFPFWAPDNEHIGFFAQRKLKTVGPGGAIRILCEAPSGLGGAWNREGVILFSAAISGPIYRITAEGGAPIPVTPIEENSTQSHCWPVFLPDGKNFLFYSFRTSPGDLLGNGIYLGTLGSSNARLVSSEMAGNVAFSSGRLFYIRDRSLVAQPFDPERLRFSGGYLSIADQELDSARVTSLAGFTVSDTGLLVFQSTSDSAAKLIWFDSAGKELGPFSDGAYRDVNFSPDGRFLAVSSDDARNGKYFIRVYDLARNIPVRLSDNGREAHPVWSHDAKDITYDSTDGRMFYLNRVPADGSGSAQLLKKGTFMTPDSWSPDGHLAFMTLRNRLPFLEIYSSVDRSVAPFVPGAQAQFSPDGKWIAYIGQGGVAGGGGIVVQPFPGPGPHMQISEPGGAQPRWSHDGKSIFYIAPDRKLMAVEFDPDRPLASPPRELFQTRIIAPNLDKFQYDVAPDGRFLINSFPSVGASPLTLVTGWDAPR